MEYKVIRSNRKTISIEIRDASVLVRAPLRASDAGIQAFVREKREWIEKHLAEAQLRKEKTDTVEKLSMAELRTLADRALTVIPERVRYYAPRIGVSYGNITIRNQRTKWGSCSNQGNLNFNVLLMLAPPEVLDSVVVHELCHRKMMNHSDRFYAEVRRVFPEYDKWHGWLKDNGALLMARMPG